MTVTINGSTGVAGVDGSASTPALQGTDTNTGVVFGADTVSIVTGGTTRATVDSSGNFQYNNGYGSVATVYGCRAWVNFNGTGTVAIRASANVTSITDNGTGDYTLNFINAMPDINYSAVGTCQFTLSGDRNVVIAAPYNQAPTTTTLRICATGGTTANLIDMLYVYVAIFR